MLKLRDIQKLKKIPEHVIKFIKNLDEDSKYVLYYSGGTMNLRYAGVYDVIKGIVELGSREYYCTYIENRFVQECK